MPRRVAGKSPSPTESQPESPQSSSPSHRTRSPFRHPLGQTRYPSSNQPAGKQKHGAKYVDSSFLFHLSENFHLWESDQTAAHRCPNSTHPIPPLPPKFTNL